MRAVLFFLLLLLCDPATATATATATSAKFVRYDQPQLAIANVRLVDGTGAYAGPANAAPITLDGDLEETALNGLNQFVLDALHRANAPGAAISIVKDGQVILAKGYGVRSLSSGEPMTEDTIYPIQSVTKAFTGLTAALLQEEGKLDFDAPIATYIPGFRMHDPVATLEVSVRDFLTHRSGLPAHSWLWTTNDDLNRAEAMERIPHLPLIAPIRTKWRYANLGYVAVAHAVERLAGTSWEQFTAQRIFQPLGMTRTTFSREQAESDPNHIEGSMVRYGRLVETPMQGTTPLTNSTGGIYSTASDMANWMLLHLNEGSFDGRQLVRPSTIAELHKAEMITDRPLPEPQFTSAAYGLGWFVEAYRGERLVEHGGNHWGVSSAVGLLPGRKLGISVFVNLDSDLAAYLMFGILDRFIGGAGVDWVGEVPNIEAIAEEQRQRAEEREQKRVRGTAPSHPLSGYTGSFIHPGFGEIEISLAGKALVARYVNEESPLQHWHYDVFVPTATEFGNIWAMWEGMQLQFLTGFDGKVSGLRTTATVQDVVFSKVEEEIPGALR